MGSAAIHQSDDYGGPQRAVTGAGILEMDRSAGGWVIRLRYVVSRGIDEKHILGAAWLAHASGC